MSSNPNNKTPCALQAIRDAIEKAIPFIESAIICAWPGQKLDDFNWLVSLKQALTLLDQLQGEQSPEEIYDELERTPVEIKSYPVGQPTPPKLSEAEAVRESSGMYGYEISGNTIYIGRMRPDRMKVADITCTIDWDEAYTEESKARRIRDAERICRGLNRE